MHTAIKAFKRTNVSLGLTGPRLFITDDPGADKQWFTQNLESLQIQQNIYDSQITDDSHVILPQINDDIYENTNTTIVSQPVDIRQAINALRELMKNRIVGLDYKWPVIMNRYGYLTSSGKVSLIQICSIDNEDKLHVILIWVGYLKSLPN